MDNISTLIIYAAITAFAFFVAAPILLNAISTFTVQKKFAEEMVERGIVSADKINEMQGKKQLAGVIVSAVVIGALVYVALKNSPYGLICTAIGLALGIVRYRDVLTFNSLTVKRFQNTYRDFYDEKKLNRYIDETF